MAFSQSSSSEDEELDDSVPVRSERMNELEKVFGSYREKTHDDSMSTYLHSKKGMNGNTHDFSTERATSNSAPSDSARGITFGLFPVKNSI